MSTPNDERSPDEDAREASAGETVGQEEGAFPEPGQEEAGTTADDVEQEDPAQINAALKDQLLRTLADMENLRNRSRREQEDALKYANTNFARDLLNVSDNLRRALDSVPDGAEQENEALKVLKEGIEMTERELQTVFARHGISTIDPVGEKFDHNAHQAMCKVPGSGAAPGTVVQVMQIGYILKDRLLRPAMVGVAGDQEGAGADENPGSTGVDTTA